VKKSIAALLMCLISMSASAGGDDWGTKDTWILGGAMGLLAIDWAQTHDLARRNTTYYLTPACSDPATRSLAGPCPPQSSQPYHEVNPLLPNNPSTGDVDKYFAIAMVGTAGLSYVLAPTYRRYFLGGVIVLESLVVLRNHQIGLRLSF
jgi:hypothetical protein